MSKEESIKNYLRWIISPKIDKNALFFDPCTKEYVTDGGERYTYEEIDELNNKGGEINEDVLSWLTENASAIKQNPELFRKEAVDFYLRPLKYYLDHTKTENL